MDVRVYSDPNAAQLWKMSCGNSKVLVNYMVYDQIGKISASTPLPPLKSMEIDAWLYVRH